MKGNIGLRKAVIKPSSILSARLEDQELKFNTNELSILFNAVELGMLEIYCSTAGALPGPIHSILDRLN